MLKLMKLELKKFKIGIKGAIIADLIMLVVIFLSIFVVSGDKDLTLSYYDNLFYFVSTIVRSTFIIFAAVLISRLIIGEYRNKTINIMFMYPLKRKKIMLAKLIIIVIFTFLAMVLSSIFLDFSLYILNIFLGFIHEPLTFDLILKNLINLVEYSAAFSFVSLIPVYVGMIKRSGTATIVSSILVLSVFNSGSSNVSLSSFIIFPIIGGILGIIGSYMAINNIEDVDVVC